MDNKVLAEMIREKISAGYKLQLNKFVDLEDKFLKDFQKINRINTFIKHKKVKSSLSKLTKLLNL